MPRLKKDDELTRWISELYAFTYSIQQPGTIYFHHTVLAKTEPMANAKATKLYPGARLVLVSSSKRVTA
jgi:hypothetical protein